MHKTPNKRMRENANVEFYVPELCDVFLTNAIIVTDKDRRSRSEVAYSPSRNKPYIIFILLASV